jgi:peptidoglycan/xylan/chitin deacetylase (PgdA/CDA1 family)
MGEAADVGDGGADGPLHHVLHPSLAEGYPRLFGLLERQGIGATFFVEGWNGEHHPAHVAEIVERGHELGMHGWVHERWSELAPDVERGLVARATAALERAAGVRPRGFRAPGGARTAATEEILLAHGYHYDASLGAGMRPARLPRGMPQVPFVWSGVDGAHYLRPKPARPEDVRDAWLAALARTAERGGLFLTVCHAFLTGASDERAAALEAVVAASVADPRIEVWTAHEVAERVRSADAA